MARDEPLESFWAELAHEPEATVRVSLIVPPAQVKTEARAIQEAFRDLDWIAPLPDHFLHVTVREGSRPWAEVAPFPIVYRRANCFHDAVIVEAHAEDVFPPPPFLPHMSIGYMRRTERPDRLREALLPFRGVELGMGVVEKVLVCDVPVGKTSFLQPWTVVETVRLGESAV